MIRKGLYTVGLDKLEATLDAYGADRTRWPAPLRHALSGLIAGNADAQKLLRDAEAFDRVLDSAPQYDASRLASLTERIVAAAERQPRVVAERRDVAMSAMPAMSRRHNGLAATALAASLVLGVLAGQTSAFNALLGGDGSRATSASMQIAQSDDSDACLDEDLL
jgi:hypothetical protein